MRGAGVTFLILALAGSAAAGEIVFTNGSRLEGELANETLIVSTGSDLIEVAPGQISALTQDEIRFKDGRVLRGTLVGGQFKARTALGEIVIKSADISVFRATEGTAPTAPASPAVPARAQAPPAPSAPVAAAAQPEPAASPAPAPLPSTAGPGRAPVATAAAATSPAPEPRATGQPIGTRWFEVTASESALYRDAVENAARVGKVTRGERVTFVDFIDRRLRIMNTLIFDGGHWIRVRAASGAEGWVPADRLRELP